MESQRQFGDENFYDIVEDNIISLDEQRAARAQKTEAKNDDQDAVQCEGGVCTVTWRPQRPAA